MISYKVQSSLTIQYNLDLIESETDTIESETDTINSNYNFNPFSLPTTSIKFQNLPQQSPQPTNETGPLLARQSHDRPT